MEISVVIPIDGRAGFLARCLETLLRQEAVANGLAVEVVVIDNSRDETRRTEVRDAAMAARQRFVVPSVRICYVPALHADPNHRNASYPINVGIRVASAPVVMICAADILHVTQTLAQHLDRHRSTAKLLLLSFCRDCPPTISLEPDRLLSASYDETQALRMASHTDWYGGMCCSIKRADLLAVNGFEERFRSWGYEDYDLARRLILFGATILRDDAIRVLHQSHPSKSSQGRKMKFYAGLRQLFAVRSANRGRPWGQLSSPPEILAAADGARTFQVAPPHCAPTASATACGHRETESLRFI